jgi:hypothetical protein
MRLKRVQMRLEGVWQGLHSLVTHKGAGRGAGGGGGESDALHRQQRLREVHHLRHHMSHLVGNLQIYIQLDVIESNHKQLGMPTGDGRDSRRESMRGLGSRLPAAAEVSLWGISPRQQCPLRGLLRLTLFVFRLMHFSPSPPTTCPSLPSDRPPEDRIGAARDFAEAERAHAAYLHALVNQCFLNTGTITRAIGAVFTQVQVGR